MEIALGEDEAAAERLGQGADWRQSAQRAEPAGDLTGIDVVVGVELHMHARGADGGIGDAQEQLR